MAKRIIKKYRLKQEIKDGTLLTILFLIAVVLVGIIEAI